MKIEYTYTSDWFSDNAANFDLWFDPNTFNWKFGHLLARFCSDHCHKWFDADKFEWYYSYYLVRHCIKHIDIWYDSSRFDKSYDELLIESIK